MEKVTLNNEIVLCRSSIRKARVNIIRKKIKKIQILKKCKKKEHKEKKLKKAERLVEEVLILKKVREDDVTKFALQNKDLDTILKKTPSNDHEHAYATLGLHPEVQKRVQYVRQNIPDWETSLPKLMHELGTRTMLKKWRRINNGRPLKTHKLNPSLPDKTTEVDQSDSTDIPKNKKTRQSVFEKNDLGGDCDKSKQNKESQFKTVGEDKLNKKEVSRNVVVEEKVDDPFFVAKKVALPKLLLSEVLENPQKEIKFSRDDPEPSYWSTKNKSSDFKSLPQSKRGHKFAPRDASTVEEPAEQEKLHPSWAAKKVKLIQPFQGKKIKFEFD